MARIPPLMVLPPVIFLGLAVLFFVGMQREDPDGLPSVLVGRSAPPIENVRLDNLPGIGAEVFADGNVKLVNFWASWCPPCRAEHPNLLELARELPVYGVNKGDKQADAVAFLEELGNPFSGIVFDEKGRQSIDWGVYGLPETFILDGSGKIVYRHTGAITQRIMDSVIRPAIEGAR